MLILDPEINGCTVWNIHSKKSEDCVSYIKGDAKKVITSLLPYITTYVDGRDCWGNRTKYLALIEELYIDRNTLSCVYVDIFNDLGLYINVLPYKQIFKREFI